MKKEYERPQIYSFQTELNLLYTACRAGNQYPAGAVLGGCTGCPDPGCASTGFLDYSEEC